MKAAGCRKLAEMQSCGRGAGLGWDGDVGLKMWGKGALFVGATELECFLNRY